MSARWSSLYESSMIQSIRMTSLSPLASCQRVGIIASRGHGVKLPSNHELPAAPPRPQWFTQTADPDRPPCPANHRPPILDVFVQSPRCGVDTVSTSWKELPSDKWDKFCTSIINLLTAHFIGQFLSVITCIGYTKLINIEFWATLGKSRNFLNANPEGWHLESVYQIISFVLTVNNLLVFLHVRKDLW